MSPLEKQQSFHKELKELLLKYKAEITIEDVSPRVYNTDEQIVINFDYDESLYEKYNTGIIPELILGRCEDYR